MNELTKDTDWKAVLEQRLIDIAKLEELVSAGEIGEGYMKIENEFYDEDDGSIYLEDCIDCGEQLNKCDIQIYHHVELDEYLCTLICAKSHQRNRLSNFKLFLKDLEELAKGDK